MITTEETFSNQIRLAIYFVLINRTEKRKAGCCYPFTCQSISFPNCRFVTKYDKDKEKARKGRKLILGITKYEANNTTCKQPSLDKWLQCMISRMSKLIGARITNLASKFDRFPFFLW